MSGKWQYSRWVWNIARSMLTNPPSASEVAATETYIKVFWDAGAQTGTRTWLKTPFNKKAVWQPSDYIGDTDVEPSHVDVEMLAVVARDLKKHTQFTSTEQTACDTLISATGNRRYGENV